MLQAVNGRERERRERGGEAAKPASLPQASWLHTGCKGLLHLHWLFWWEPTLAWPVSQNSKQRTLSHKAHIATFHHLTLRLLCNPGKFWPNAFFLLDGLALNCLPGTLLLQWLVLHSCCLANFLGVPAARCVSQVFICSLCRVAKPQELTLLCCNAAAMLPADDDCNVQYGCQKAARKAQGWQSAAWHLARRTACCAVLAAASGRGSLQASCGRGLLWLCCHSSLPTATERSLVGRRRLHCLHFLCCAGATACCRGPGYVLPTATTGRSRLSSPN